MKVKASIYWADNFKPIADLELARVPMKDEYILIKGRRYRVVEVRFIDNGAVEIGVGV